MKKTTNAPDSGNELERVKAELAELKQRFGIDKQEVFLKAHANISLKEFAAMLHGRDCQPNLTPDEFLLAQQRGFVVVYGDSDDRVEFEGALRAEGDTNPLAKDRLAGVLVLSENGELLNEDSELYAEYIKENRNAIFRSVAGQKNEQVRERQHIIKAIESPKPPKEQKPTKKRIRFLNFSVNLPLKVLS